MPKGKKKDHRSNKERNYAPEAVSDDEAETVDTVSAISSLSDHQATITDGSTDCEGDETAALGNLEEKLHTCVEGLSQKSAKGRVESLHTLRAILTKKYLIDSISQNKLSISDNLERSLKKGKEEEQCAAAACCVLVLIQLGASQEREEIFPIYYPLLKTILADNAASFATRAACAEALALCTFIVAEETKLIEDAMTALENIFKLAYGKSAASCTTDAYSMLNSAMAAWTLLLTIAPDSFIQNSTATHLCKLASVLSSANMELRRTAGEAIALLYEKAREIDETFEEDNFDELCLSLKGLSTECNKYRSKKDRRQQKSSFREILGTVESGNFTGYEVKFNPYEAVYIDSWTLRTQYNALCRVLGPGMNIHLQENELLRDIFQLGPPALKQSVPNCRSVKQERHMYHDAAFKARTKSRKKMREIKSVCTTTVD